MYARTGASPSAFAICGLPPDRRTPFSAFFTLVGLAAPRLAFTGDLDLVTAVRGLLARDVGVAFALVGMRTAVYSITRASLRSERHGTGPAGRSRAP